jgi:hypothetical protein
VHHQERQTQPIHLPQMHRAVALAAVLAIRQSADNRNLFTAMLAIHGGTKSIWVAKPRRDRITKENKRIRIPRMLDGGTECRSLKSGETKWRENS